MDNNQTATWLQIIGACGFGMIIGWNVYFINRYRQGDVKLNDLTKLVGVIGGGAVLALFPAGSDLFGAYGIGLFFGFFGYFLVLCWFVNRSENFDIDWFLDGRRKVSEEGVETPKGTRPTATAMDNGDNDEGSPIG